MTAASFSAPKTQRPSGSCLGTHHSLFEMVLTITLGIYLGTWLSIATTSLMIAYFTVGTPSLGDCQLKHNSQLWYLSVDIAKLM